MTKSKITKVAAGIMAAAMLCLSIGTALAAPKNSKDKMVMNKGAKHVKVSTEKKEEKRAYYGSFTGTVKQISQSQSDKTLKYILLEGKDGEIANIVVSASTYYVDNVKVEVGSKITGYYVADAPMFTIYPPQYTVDVVAASTQNIKVDVFDKELVSADGMLKLNLSDKTQILLRDGSVFKAKGKGVLKNRRLVVFYDVSTRSIPAQTTPTKIVLLSKKQVEYKHPDKIDFSKIEIMVNDKKIDAPQAYLNKKGVIMLPLQPVAKALNYAVSANEKFDIVTIAKTIIVKAGAENCIDLRRDPFVVQLEAKAEIKDKTVYVPLSFFTQVMGMKHAYAAQDQIIISNED